MQAVDDDVHHSLDCSAIKTMFTCTYTTMLSVLVHVVPLAHVPAQRPRLIAHYGPTGHESDLLAMQCCHNVCHSARLAYEEGSGFMSGPFAEWL